MKVVGLFLLRPNRGGEDGAEPTFLASATDVSSYGFFQRGAAKEFLTFSARKIANTLEPNLRCTCTEKGYHIHAFLTRDNVASVIIVSEDYPKRVAFGVVAQLAMDFVQAQGTSTAWRSVKEDNALSFPAIDQLLAKAQDPAACDNIAKIQKQLDQTKEILHDTIMKAIERGENLDEMVQRSEDLSATSKLFFTSAQKANKKCCVVM